VLLFAYMKIGNSINLAMVNPDLELLDLMAHMLIAS